MQILRTLLYEQLYHTLFLILALIFPTALLSEQCPVLGQDASQKIQNYRLHGYASRQVQSFLLPLLYPCQNSQTSLAGLYAQHPMWHQLISWKLLLLCFLTFLSCQPIAWQIFPLIFPQLLLMTLLFPVSSQEIHSPRKRLVLYPCIHYRHKTLNWQLCLKSYPWKIHPLRQISPELAFFE